MFNRDRATFKSCFIASFMAGQLINVFEKPGENYIYFLSFIIITLQSAMRNPDANLRLRTECALGACLGLYLGGKFAAMCKATKQLENATTNKIK